MFENMEPFWICVCGNEVPGECPRCLCGRTEEESDAEKNKTFSKQQEE